MPLSKIQGIEGQVTPNLGRRNLVINGDMRIAQRGTSSSALGLQTVDRFSHNSDRQQFVATQEQSTDVPTGKGYTTSYKITTTTPETAIDGNNYNTVRYIFEAQDLQHLCWGTSAAKSLSVSFWVKSSVTGTYVTSNYFYDPNRNITVPYTISSANTWEYKTIVIPGDTGGTINNDNGAGLAIQFALSVGPNYQGTVSTSWGSYVDARWGNGQTAQMMNVNGATWAITGLQVEVGSIPTDFEHRSFGEELSLCQRYYEQVGSGAPALANSSTQFWTGYQFKTEKRAEPTASVIASTVRYFKYGIANRDNSSPSIGQAYYSPRSANIRVDGFSSLSANESAMTGGSTSNHRDAMYAFEAEL